MLIQMVTEDKDLCTDIACNYATTAAKTASALNLFETDEDQDGICDAHERLQLYGQTENQCWFSKRSQTHVNFAPRAGT